MNSIIPLCEVILSETELTAAQIPSAAITYQLIIELTRSQPLTVGKLGSHIFLSGIYVYTGSARQRMYARVRRHVAKQKTCRWHIDYLLQSADATITTLRFFQQPECLVNQSIRAEIAIPGFGASDCRNGCGAHLKMVRDGG